MKPWLAAALLVVPLLAPPRATEARRGGPHAPPPFPSADGCATCHPGARKGLEASPHRALLADPARAAQACTACHGQAEAHVTSARARLAGAPGPAVVPPPAVAASACAACHDAGQHAVATAAHPLRRDVPWQAAPAREPQQPASQPATRPEPRDSGREPAPPPGLDAMEMLGFDWRGLARAGWRFVNEGGSRGRYDTDINLDPGPRLTDFELEGTARAPGGVLDRLRFSARDVEDPWMHLDAEFAREGTFRATADWDKSVFVYRARGPYSRVDKVSDDAGGTLDLELSRDTELFFGYRRLQQDATWLSRRLVQRNPPRVVNDVYSPRTLDSDTAEAGITTRFGGTALTLAAEYLDERTLDRWVYDQPSPINPAFPESEDLRSEATLRGPGGRLQLDHEFTGGTFDLGARYLARERRIVGRGDQQGYDVGRFQTTTDALATGRADTLLVDATSSVDLGEDLELLLEARWRDHEEVLRSSQTDTTVYPDLGLSNTVTTNLYQVTRQEVFEAAAALAWQAGETVSLRLGYGYAHERLRVPDLESGDADFASGTTTSHGVQAGLRWAPNRFDRLDVDLRGYGEGGAQLHPVVEDEGRGVKVSAWRRQIGEPNGAAKLFAELRNAENDVSRYRDDEVRAGVHLSASPLADPSQPAGRDTMEYFLGYTFARSDTRVLTNFYFDPDPDPVPTMVGFRGDSHTIAGGGRFGSSRGRIELDLSFSDVSGSFDVRAWQARLDVAGYVREVPGAEIGVEVRRVEYDEEGGIDDYDAWIVFVYWRQRMGR
ncbi:MAG: hypothetical protein IT458_20745 [Planctomycetes bacterium]|nr:hypothetical protein [Planctomycetota bacterium]